MRYLDPVDLYYIIQVGLRVHSNDDIISERVKEEMDEEIKQVLKVQSLIPSVSWSTI